jgi:hypothetical protein
MTPSRTLDVGLDGPKAAMAVADVAAAHQAAGIDLGSLGTRQGDIAQRSRTRPATSHHLVFVDEAGPWGAWRSRDLTTKGHSCGVVAPARSPKQTGDRVHTTRRDASPWARLRRSGALTPVYGPPVAADALRDLRRARAEARRALQTAQPRLNALLLRHAIRETGRATGGPAHRRWLRAVVCPTPAQPSVCHAEVRAVTAHRARRGRREPARQAQGHPGRLWPVGDALQALRGVQCPVAVTTVAARGDLARCDQPRPRMSDLGLPPAASSTGDQRRPGALTTTGQAHARRALLAGAGASRDPAQGRRPLHWRLAQLPTPRQGISWQAQVRRCTRARHLRAQGQHPHRVVGAIARKLSAFRGAMAQQGPVPSSTPSGDGPCITREPV